jgi:hypothetical protein
MRANHPRRSIHSRCQDLSKQQICPLIRMWAEMMKEEEFFETVCRFENPEWCLCRNNIENKLAIVLYKTKNFVQEKWLISEPVP